jgi:hypothetical protein
LKGSESSLQIGGVGLEVVKSARNAGLKLRRLLARRAVCRDLVDGAHGCGGCRERKFCSSAVTFLICAKSLKGKSVAIAWPIRRREPRITCLPIPTGSSGERRGTSEALGE